MSEPQGMKTPLLPLLNHEINHVSNQDQEADAIYGKRSKKIYI